MTMTKTQLKALIRAADKRFFIAEKDGITYLTNKDAYFGLILKKDSNLLEQLTAKKVDFEPKESIIDCLSKTVTDKGKQGRIELVATDLFIKDGKRDLTILKGEKTLVAVNSAYLAPFNLSTLATTRQDGLGAVIGKDENIGVVAIMPCRTNWNNVLDALGVVQWTNKSKSEGVE